MDSLGIQSRPPQLAELEEGQSVTVLVQPKTLGGGAPLAAQYREYKRVGNKLLSWTAKDMQGDVDWTTTVPDTLTVTTIPAGTADYDKFLVSDGGAIKYRTAAQMIDDLGISMADHAHALSDLTDVVITGPADLDVLQHNGANWVDRTLAEAGISATEHLHDDRYYTETEINAMDLVYYTGTPTAGHIPYFTAADTIAMDNGQLFWDAANNRLGVGTVNPGATVELQSSSPVLRLRDTGAIAGATTAFVEFGGTDAGVWSRTGYVGDASSGNTAICLRAEISDLHLGDSSSANVMILQDGNVGIGLTTVDANYKLIIRRAANINLGIGLQSSELAIAAFNDALSANIPMRFYASEFNFLNGNVGIGIAVPTAKAHIYGAGAQSLKIESSGGSSAVLKLINTTDEYQIYCDGTTGDLRFWNGADRVTIEPGGYVGIGTNSPSRLLQVEANNADADILISSIGTGVASQLLFGDEVSPTVGYLSYNHVVDSLLIGVNSVTAITILSTSFVGIGTDTMPYLLTLKNEGTMGDVSYSSGWAGTDWALTYLAGLATLQIDDLFVRGSLTVYELIINQINAVNGAMIISPARGKVASVTGSPATEVVTMEDPEGNGYTTFAANDIVMIQRVDLNAAYTIVKRIIRKVASASGAAVTMSAAAGAPADTASIAVGDVVVVIGNVNNTARDASIYMTSTDANNPYIQVMDGVTSWADWTGVGKIKCVLGNLNGKYGYASELYGFAAGDYSAAAGKQYFSIDPTNGLRIMQYQGSWKTMLVASADLLQVGNTADKFKYVPSTNVLTVAGWTVNSSYFGGGNARLTSTGILSLGSGSIDFGEEDMIYIDGSGAGRISVGANFTYAADVLTVAGWTVNTSTLEKLASNVGVKLDAANAKIQVGDLDEQHIDLLGADGTIKWYRRTGVNTSELTIIIDDNIWGGHAGVSIINGVFRVKNPSGAAQFSAILSNNSTIEGGVLSLSDYAGTNEIRLEVDGTAGAHTRITAGSLWSSAGAGTALHWYASGEIKRYTSSLRYKEDVAALEIDPSILHNLEVKSYTPIGSKDRTFGLIAEEVALVEPQLVVYDKKGRPDAIRQPLIDYLMLEELKKLRVDVDGTKELHARLVDLEGEVATLRTQLGLA